MTGQVLYMLMLYVLGWLLLVPARDLSRHCRCLLALFAGMMLWSCAVLLLLMVSVPVTPVTAVLFCAAGIGSVVWFFRRNVKVLVAEKAAEAAAFLSYAICLVMVVLASYTWNYTILTPDSFKYVGIGMDIARSGRFPPPGMDAESVSYFLKGVISFMPALWAGACFFNIDFCFTIFPVSASWFLVVLVILFVRLTDPVAVPWTARWVVGACGAALLASVPSYWHHGCYVSISLFTGIYFTVCIAGVFIYRANRKLVWLVIAGASLSATTLLRREMGIFAAIPVAVLMGTKGLDRKHYATFMVVFLALSVPWQCYRFRLAGFGDAHPARALVQVLPYIAYGFSYVLVHFKWCRQKLAVLVPDIMVATLLVFVITFMFVGKRGMLRSVVGLLNIFSSPTGFIEGGDAGFIWLTMLMVGVANLFFLRSDYCNMWLRALVAFFCIRLGIYAFDTFFTNPAVNQYNSGNRMLVHIMPTAVLFIVLCVGHGLAQVCEGRAGVRDSRGDVPEKPKAQDGLLT